MERWLSCDGIAGKRGFFYSFAPCFGKRAGEAGVNFVRAGSGGTEALACGIKRALFGRFLDRGVA